MYASPPPLMRSQNYRKLSPALASSPHLFTPPHPVRGALTPGLSPIDRSPRPPRPVHTSVRAPPRRPFLEKLLNVMDDSHEDGLASGIDEDESSPPPSSFHLGCTSTPPRATPRQSISPFTSPLSTSSSLDIPLSCVPSPLHRRGHSPTGERQRSGTPPLSVTLKRPRTSGPLTRREKKRLKIAAPESPLAPSSVHSSIRTFPPSIPIHPEFPGFYIRFPVIPPVLKASSGCTLNPPRDVLDLYTPRLVRGSGHTKVGLCPLCACIGMGKVWLSMKFSAYKCLQSVLPSPTNAFQAILTCARQLPHAIFSCPIIVAEECFASGIAASTARPFSPPIAFRTTPRQRPGKLERTQILEGQCHRCMRWVPVQGVKDTEAKVLHLSLFLDRLLNVWRAGCKVKELFWWKHACNVPWYEHDTGRAQHIHLGLNQLTIEYQATTTFSV
ncbi:hypothetical protein F5888DRAFT_1636531 [Russula emetica]|nr:hypothetical protein F5888DRAFT_1636531 [Russula emetica]